MLMITSFQLAFNSMTLISLVPIALEVERAFKLESAYPVNMCAIVFAIQSLPMTFVAIAAYNTFKVRTILIASAII